MPFTPLVAAPSFKAFASLLGTVNATLLSQIAKLVEPIGVEFHRDLALLLRQFSEADLERFVSHWSRIDPGMRSAFVAFVVTGDDPDGRFLKYLDENRECQQAVDLAFAAHIDTLHDLGKSLTGAGQVVEESKNKELVSLLSEAERAEIALANAEGALENMKGVAPVLQNVQEALSAVGDTKRGLRALAGMED
jgi:hypothetical protein